MRRKCCSGSKGRLSETLRPLATSPAAAALFSGVIRLTAPFSSSSPQRPQLRRSVYHDSTSAWDGMRGSACAAGGAVPAATVARACRSRSSAGEKASAACTLPAPTPCELPDARARVPPATPALPAAAPTAARNRRLEVAIVCRPFLPRPCGRAGARGRAAGGPDRARAVHATAAGGRLPRPGSAALATPCGSAAGNIQ